MHLSPAAVLLSLFAISATSAGSPALPQPGMLRMRQTNRDAVVRRQMERMHHRALARRAQPSSAYTCSNGASFKVKFSGSGDSAIDGYYAQLTQDGNGNNVVVPAKAYADGSTWSLSKDCYLTNGADGSSPVYADTNPGNTAGDGQDTDPDVYAVYFDSADIISYYGFNQLTCDPSGSVLSCGYGKKTQVWLCPNTTPANQMVVAKPKADNPNDCVEVTMTMVSA